MSIFEKLFGGLGAQQPQQQPAQQQQQQAPAQPGNLPATPPATNPVGTAGTANNGVVPNNNATDNTSKSGLDAFADIWNTAPNPGQQGQPLFNVSQDKMMEAARKQNFVNGINPEHLAKAAAGGQEGIQAILDIVNTATQNAYAQSAFAGTKLIEGALDKSQFARTSDLDNRFKTLTVSNSLQAENPIFSNPAAKPMLDSIQQNLIVKYPNATPTELANMAKSYLQEFVSAANAPQAQQQQQQQAAAKKGDDWSAFFA